MTEGFEDGNYLVRVRAQVMSRDDSSGGWVPLGGGGLSNVSVRKRLRIAPSTATATASELSQPKHDYLIYGKRISDQSIVLQCTIKKDFEYNKVMPTFHHWKTGDKKFGLTFQTAADARAFDKGVRTAIEDLLDAKLSVQNSGVTTETVPSKNNGSEPPSLKNEETGSIVGLTETYPLSPLHNYHKDVGDDDVFMTLNLPVEAGESRSSSDSSTKGGGSGMQPEHLHRIHYIGRDKPLPPLDQRESSKDPGKGFSGENYSYVHLTAVHEYIYPVMDDQKPTPCRRDSTSSLKKRSFEVIPSQPPLLSKAKHKNNKNLQTLCRHCHDRFSEDNNPRGSCEYAPDCIKTGINRISCISCAQCMLYHCMADAEGDFAAHPCECGTIDENCGKRWLGLALLSLFVPCLWCYPPLKLCHWCGVTCGICGGRHSIY